MPLSDGLNHYRIFGPQGGSGWVLQIRVRPSIRPCVLLTVVLEQILAFPKTLHGVRGPYGVVRDRA